MAKYMLARGQTRLPIEGVRETKRENDKPLRTTETVLFSPNKVVESDLDFGSWVREGVLIRLDVPPTLRPDPRPAAAPAMILPTPIPAQVEVIREVPKVERPVQAPESHITTKPVPPPVEAPIAPPVEQIKFEDEAPPVEAPKAPAAPVVEEVPEEDEPVIASKDAKGKVDATKQMPRGDGRGKRRR
jgi:hypothetical protein